MSIEVASQKICSICKEYVYELNPRCKDEQYYCCNCWVKMILTKFGDPGNNIEIDPVNHPPHYNAHPSGVECITITEHFNFNLGNAIKYIWRAGEKGDKVEDLKKAKWYLEREIGRLEK